MQKNWRMKYTNANFSCKKNCDVGNIIKQPAQAFNSAYIEFWRNTQEVRGAFDRATSNFYASFALSVLTSRVLALYAQIRASISMNQLLTENVPFHFQLTSSMAWQQNVTMTEQPTFGFTRIQFVPPLLSSEGIWQQKRREFLLAPHVAYLLTRSRRFSCVFRSRIWHIPVRFICTQCRPW